MGDVLIVVKDDKLAGRLATACQDRGAATFRALGAAQALPEINRAGGGRAWAGLLLDLGYSQGKPLDLARDFLEANPDLKIVALGRQVEVKTLTALMRLGVFDFLELPPDPEELSRCLDKFLGRLGPEKDDKARPPARAPGRYGPIVGRSAALKRVFRLVDKVAATDSTVMIHGESGTGKELIARAIHQVSPRADKALIPVNCGAIPEELLEAELFGHEKGAFTNAIRTRIGRFEMADGGSIFLDEIGDMSPKLQVKLLRVLQEHEIERVGGDRVISVDIRVITATHVDLVRAVEDGRFREDLFYRLNVIPITVPPLRERLDDLPLLIDYFLARFRETRGSEVLGVDREALNRLLTYNWPGNVRELENLVERMVTLAEEKILTVEDLPGKLLKATEGLEPPLIAALPPEGEADDPEPAATGPEEKAELRAGAPPAAETGGPVGADLSADPVRSADWAFPPEGLDFNALVSAYEERLIRAALEAAGGVKNQAARLLGLNRTTLVEKMRKKGLGSEDG
ncbi:MAG: sigma-54 dependent transcriptional regulator [Candidatus Adiutrix sp.]|nr:sigma-54 dependent transcriptional regulator [Candidatus Adiutrix sp.]